MTIGYPSEAPGGIESQQDSAGAGFLESVPC